jgi:hypothetical protein
MAIPLSGVSEPAWAFQHRDADSGVLTASTGLAPVLYYSLTREFSTAEAAGDFEAVTMTERDDVAGEYVASVTEDNKATLSEYVGRVLYEIVLVDGIVRGYQAVRFVDL